MTPEQEELEREYLRKYLEVGGLHRLRTLIVLGVVLLFLTGVLVYLCIDMSE